MSRNSNIWDVFWMNPGTNGAECSRKVAIGRKVAGAIRAPVNGDGLQL